jgi:RNA polymerase sigma factor (sigma-70 family)
MTIPSGATLSEPFAAPRQVDRRHDDELMQLVESGHADEGLRVLQERYGRRILHFVRGLLRDVHLAQDVTQEVFEKVFLKSHLYQPGTNFRAWLFEVARNQALSALRARRRNPRPVSSLGNDGGRRRPGLPREPARAPRQPRTRGAGVHGGLPRAPSRSCPTATATVFTLCVREGRPYQEAAERLRPADRYRRDPDHAGAQAAVPGAVAPPGPAAPAARLLPVSGQHRSASSLREPAGPFRQARMPASAPSSPPTPHVVTCRLSGQDISLETGRIARQASGAVLARRNDDLVLATVVHSGGRGDLGFFPLTVEYREKFAAVGRIPGNVQRREGRITDHEVLICRLIDRSIRSLFPKGFHEEVQIQVSVLSADPQSDVASLAIVAACAAIHVSALPADGPAAGLRIVRTASGGWTPFPTLGERARAELDFVVSEGPTGPVMVEGEAREIPRETAIEALTHALEWTGKLRVAIDELRSLCGAPAKLEVEPVPEPPVLTGPVADELAAALQIASKAERSGRVSELRRAFLDGLPDDADRDAAGRLVRQGEVPHRARADPRRARAHRRARPRRHPVDLVRERLAAARARVGDLHARRDAGARHVHARDE